MKVPIEHFRLSHDLSAIKGFQWLIGVDEAGRGALAGPVVAGAVAVKLSFLNGDWPIDSGRLVNDSKKLSEAEREKLFERFTRGTNLENVVWTSRSASVDEIEKYNILGATKLAMIRALEGLIPLSEGQIILPGSHPQCSGREKHFTLTDYEMETNPGKVVILIDGNPLSPFPYKHNALVGGDGRSWTIGMASIIAKVSRDRIMRDLATKLPDYHFEENKGYGTAKHKCSLITYGISPSHRPAFLRKLQAQQDSPIQYRFDFDS